MLAVSIVLVALIQGAFSNCPEIRTTEKREYPVGSTIQVTCPGSSTLTYIATCTNSGLWDHSLLVNVCAGTGVSLDLATQPPSIAPPATAPPSPPVSIMSTMTCPFLPGFMEADDATKTYPEGVVYQMICSNGGGRFAATCQNGAWVYRINSCPGIVTSPPPTTTTTTTPSTVPLVTCPFLSGYMVDDDKSITFQQGDGYSMACNPPNQARRFQATCNNGQWFGNMGTCTSGGGLGGLFNTQATQAPTPAVQLRNCTYMGEMMAETDVGATFYHGTVYRFGCVDPNSVVTTIQGTCNNGAWSYNPNDCFRSPSTSQNGLQIGNTNIPLWFFLLG